jgi:hypothetical protein
VPERLEELDFFVEDTYSQASPIGSLATGTCVT